MIRFRFVGTGSELILDELDEFPESEEDTEEKLDEEPDEELEIDDKEELEVESESESSVFDLKLKTFFKQ